MTAKQDNPCIIK